MKPKVSDCHSKELKRRPTRDRRRQPPTNQSPRYRHRTLRSRRVSNCLASSFRLTLQRLPGFHRPFSSRTAIVVVVASLVKATIRTTSSPASAISRFPSASAAIPFVKTSLASRAESFSTLFVRAAASDRGDNTGCVIDFPNHVVYRVVDKQVPRCVHRDADGEPQFSERGRLTVATIAPCTVSSNHGDLAS